MSTFDEMFEKEMRKYVEREQQATAAAYAAMMEQARRGAYEYHPPFGYMNPCYSPTPDPTPRDHEKEHRKYFERRMLEEAMKPPEYGESPMRAWMDIYANAPKVNEGPFYTPGPEYQRREKPKLEPFPFELRVTANVIYKCTNFKFSWTDDWGEELMWQLLVTWREIDTGFMSMDQHIHRIFERFYRAMDSARIY